MIKEAVLKNKGLGQEKKVGLGEKGWVRKKRGWVEKKDWIK